MKSPNDILQYILEDLGMWCRTSTSHDLKTIMARVEHEGWSFLTITLPAFGKDFERSLDQGFVGPTQFYGFRRSGGLPLFLGGFLDCVFDRRSGELLSVPSIACIQAIRQLTLMFAKISLECSPAREKAAMRRYVECEQEVAESSDNLPPEMVDRYCRVGTLLWGDVLSGVDSDVYNGNIVARHGPGATADKLRGNAKWSQSEWTWRLEQVFPHGEHLASSWRYFQDLQHVRFLEPGTERPTRVVPVPKTLKTPRIIAIEPTCMQFMQQGLLASLQRWIGTDNSALQLVGWTSQVPNQHLACQGSSNGTLASLDLKEASDRVSNQHVRLLLRNHSSLAGAVDSTRSRKADVPGHGVISLAKFASMGSALCFPFEAMVFATIIFSAIEEDLARPITRKDIKSYLGKVRVYGDDIIVPVEHVHSVIRYLEGFGLLVNRDKSFWTGKFRESCGGDFYDGHDVTIVRMRSVLPDHRQQTREDYAGSVVSTVSFRNQLYKAGLWKTVEYLDSYLEGLIPFPYVSEISPVLGRYSFLGIEPGGRVCPDLQIPLVKGMRVKATIPRSRLEGYAALNKCLTTMFHREGAPLEEVLFRDACLGDYTDYVPTSRGSEHLEYAGRPVAVDIKHRWGPA
ncbi:TPA_asm: RNA-directed RNA polymerase [ssRNA phage Gerhypos.2_30]|uniref:RNA-directed RNA polymerase n=2 Tax=Leviviricetes TaxID=2842243 RepID=A0A8S5KZ73_9VIRU|nr:RNA-directed RNA polymerase [ssRNA phage Gerhypos.2_30]QDH88546.1 MAG: RNA-dependent RNA polymerase [Leviviridae sp.]DAD50373.1 TPA_asm: RNA-directed RNA polymerase [ssRNA phage Gerhypos.2_30]